MANRENNTRFSPTKEALILDFAEHLKYSLDAYEYHNTSVARYTALALTIRDRIIHQWFQSRSTQKIAGAKRVYYLSLEFLMGRAMTNNVINLNLEKEVRAAVRDLGYTWEEFIEVEPDAGLGNGGLGRLAACFLDSLATLDIPSMGYGIRYNYGIFRQSMRNGWQTEHPDNWLRYGNPWEIAREDRRYTVHFGGEVQMIHEKGRDQYKWLSKEQVQGIAYDMPIVGYGGSTINTLRLWSAKATEEFNFQEFNEGDYVEAVRSKILAENLSQVLYPNDTLYMGKELRLKQQYFFVACSLADIIKRFKWSNEPWSEFPNYAAIQLNDTHPSLSIPELMRILVDIENLEWDEAWEITVKTMGYTNHTLMPEALEKWPLEMLESILPRHLQIIFEINKRFLQRAIAFFPYNSAAIERLSIVQEGPSKQIRMANLSIIGSHSTNGVAQLHSRLLKERMFPEFATVFPDRFNNKTNGITQRRWLLDSNPLLAAKISEAIGDNWITDYSQIAKLKPFADDKRFRDDFLTIKQKNKERAAAFIKHDCGITLNPDTMFSVQVKRIHEYKRQLLNALNLIMLYRKVKNGEGENIPPTTFIFGGKAAPGYVNAKLIIKLIGNIAKSINNDKDVNQILNVHFLPNYRVTMAEYLIPASDLSEQISTAGFEASGTGNMKFMCNGALTIGTMDGATVEMAEEVGQQEMFIFGHSAQEIAELSQGYDPYDWIKGDAEIKGALDLLLSGYFNMMEGDIFEPLKQALLHDDRYFHLADLRDYSDKREEAFRLYLNDKQLWAKKAILNIAASGKFSSDRTIMEYTNEIWKAKRFPIARDESSSSTLNSARRRK
ncbi:MAG: glycogen/starch/alpha-glucan phosphorylase [Sphaerochaetaceae bacterium]